MNPLANASSVFITDNRRSSFGNDFCPLRRLISVVDCGCAITFTDGFWDNAGGNYLGRRDHGKESNCQQNGHSFSASSLVSKVGLPAELYSLVWRRLAFGMRSWRHARASALKMTFLGAYRSESVTRAVRFGRDDNNNNLRRNRCYSTVTLFARFLGWSTSQPRRTAMW